MARHHYVPKAILKNFLVTETGTYYYNRPQAESGPENRNIGTIFCRRHFNSYLTNDGKRDATVEKFFAEELDNHIPHWIKVFEDGIKTGDFQFKSPTDRNRFVQFFYNHTKRSPDFLDPIVRTTKEKVFHSNYIEELEKRVRKLTPEEARRIHSPEFVERTLANSRVVNLSRQSEEILDTLNGMVIVAATPMRANKQFVVGSNPVIRFESYPQQRLGEDGVELWTTLTPKLAVGFVCGPVSTETVFLSDDLVRKINLTIAKNSRAIAGRSEKLLLSLGRSAW